MSSSYVFSGASFSVRSATLIAPNVVRLSFTQPPNRINPAGPTDSLNSNNYTITGLSAKTITSIAAVVADNVSVDITVNSPFEYGNWTITAANLQTAGGTGLAAPFSAIFFVGAIQTALTAGVEGEDGASIIRKHLNAALGGLKWDALIAALGQADDYVWDLARTAFDQLFKSTASGKYLKQLAADDGTEYPTNVGLSDDQFRELAIELSTGRVTYISLLRILQSFYGKEALRAYADTQVGPFTLADGMTLVMDFEGDTYTYTVDSRSFRVVNTATAAELAIALTIFFDNKKIGAIAAPIVDSTTGLMKVRLYSPSLGLRSKLTILGGTAQRVLNFDTYQNVYNGTVTSGDAYNWTFSVVAGRTVMSLTTLGIPKIDVSSIQTDDYVVVGPDTGAIAGWYKVLSVEYVWSGSSYIQKVTLVDNIGYVGTIVQQSNTSYRFYRPTTHSILNGARTVVVSQTTDGKLDIQVPAVGDVYRDASNAAYVFGNTPVNIISLERKGNTVTVQTSGPHGLTTGNQAFVEGYVPASGRAFFDTTNVGGSWLHGMGSTGSLPGGSAARGQGLHLLSTGDIVSFGGIVPASTNSPNTTRISATQSPITNGTQATGAQNLAVTFTALGNMIGSRSQSFASSVLNGPFTDSVFVSGGIGALNTCEILTGASWTARANMILGVQLHQQVTLNDGRVLVIGGRNASNTTVATCQIFQPSLNAWVPAANLNVPRLLATAHVLPDGRVIVIGGQNLAKDSVNSCEIYDPVTNTWSYATNMGYWRDSHCSVVLPNGEILVAGGNANAGDNISSPTKTTEIYNPALNRWRLGPVMPVARNRNYAVSGASMWMVRNGSYVYVGDSGNPQVNWLDVNEFVWNVLPATSNPRSNAVAGNGFVLLSGYNSATATTFFDAITGDGVAMSPQGVNGLQAVSSAPSSDVFTYLTSQPAYTTMLSDTGVIVPAGSDYVNGWSAVNAMRSGNVTTLSMSVPQSTIAVYVNSFDVNFPSGVKLISTWSPTNISYAEIAANASGSVYVGRPLATPTSQKVEATGTDGVFVIDPDALTYSTFDSTLASSLIEGASYNVLTVASTDAFADEPGWLVLSYGHRDESKPFKYLEKISSTQLLLQGFVADGDWFAGTTVTSASQVGPDDIENAFWVTGSLAARFAAEENINESVANDVDLNWSVIYPGDRGLGGEGQANSDDSTVWGPDDYDEEE